ncbi:MAG: hypothetical protein FE78DRAFT_141741, partial [Acidomyces sp. 'richmondensis']
ILSNAEEKTLVRWIMRLTVTGYPASPALVVDMAKEIRQQRYQLLSSPAPLRPISKCWLNRFRKRHPSLQSVDTTARERSA